MAVKELFQKAWQFDNEVHINEDHLTIKKKTVNEHLEYTIKFEELGFEIAKKIDKSANNAFYVLLALNAIFVYGICRGLYKHYVISNILTQCFCLIIFGFLCFSLFKRRNKEIIYLTGGSKVLELLAAKPDSQTVSVFINEIHKAIRTYYKNKYTNFENEVTYEDKLSILKWLKEINMITDQECDELIIGYKTDKIIGFNS